MKNSAKRRSGGSHFATLPSANIRRSLFDRSHGCKTAFNEGQLIPFYIDEVLPGDTFKAKCSIFGRLSTPIVPFMDNLNIETRFFFVPSRLLWEHWEEMNGKQIDPGDSTEYEVPSFITSGTGVATGSLADYMGIPIGVKGLSVNALPFRAYYLIWNEWFRDQNLQNSQDIDFGDIATDYTSALPLKVTKYHDYFTSALPWPQKSQSVGFPLLGQAPVLGTLDSVTTISSGSANALFSLKQDNGSAVYTKGAILKSSAGPQVTGALYNGNTNATSGLETSWLHYNSGLEAQTSGNASGQLYADLSEATAGNVNDLRLAFQTQKLYELDARGGTRYAEILRAHFGVISPDARLQRPEYLGGSVNMMNVHAVEQTSATNTTSPQGNLAAFGLVANSNHAFTKSFVEHGYIIGLVCARAPLTYQQGLNRMWSRKSRFDFYWPVFAHLGEQAILNKELYAQGSAVVDSNSNPVDDGVFGYQERWAEYRYHPSYITGVLRSTATNSLDVWHLAQEFESLPTLNSDFITENAPLNRVLAVQNEPQIILDTWMTLQCARPMPVYSVPGLIDHF